MKINFYKYQGTGNDFVIIDHRRPIIEHNNKKLINRICDRKFGIGADGLILLEDHPEYDFQMIYFNADGSESSMCGNGGRCIAAFAKFLNIIATKANFLAIDGNHDAICHSDGTVDLKMNDVNQIEKNKDHYIIDTGSPHYITFVENQKSIDVYKEGKTIRYNDRFKKNGINVNFVTQIMKGIDVSTYERGVEDETLSCGTGVTAAAIAYVSKNRLNGFCQIPVKTKGGKLMVKLEASSDKYTNIWLCGPANQVFEGTIKI